MPDVEADRRDEAAKGVSLAFAFETVTVDARGEVRERTVRRGQQLTETLRGDVVLEMVAIPGGSFLMGSPKGQGYEDERPPHGVVVAPFLLAKYAFTQAQWQAVTGKVPSCRGKGAQRPVDRISWLDATSFCARLARQTGRDYRLPSEAEWEYACRAGTATPFSCGETITTDLANYVGNFTYRDEAKGSYRHETTDVGSFPPNAFGLCDMHGNVWEWCADGWHADYAGAPSDGSVWERPTSTLKVLRGGCWHDPPDLCRSAARLKFPQHEGEDFVGFRVALSSPDKRAVARGSFVQRLLGRA